MAARIWLDQELDEDGYLTADEILRCEVDGKPQDATEEWLRLADHPISESEYNYLVATSKWAAKHAPDEPEANPREKIDMNKVSLPF